MKRKPGTVGPVLVVLRTGSVVFVVWKWWVGQGVMADAAGRRERRGRMDFIVLF